MTLYDLLESAVVKHDDKITISKPLWGNAVDMRRGYWFNDQILDFMNSEIASLSWNEEKGWSIALKKEE